MSELRNLNRRENQQFVTSENLKIDVAAAVFN